MKRRQTHLGTTPSGRKVYLDKLPHEYPSFSAEDHSYAAMLHEANRTPGDVAGLHRAAADAKFRSLFYGARGSHAARRKLPDRYEAVDAHATKKRPRSKPRASARGPSSGDLEKALSDRLGFVPTENFIRQARAEWEGFTLDQLQGAIRGMTRQFEKHGGRGVDLADQIDRARTALALVDSGFLRKGEHGVLSAVQRDLPKVKSDFDY